MKRYKLTLALEAQHDLNTISEQMAENASVITARRWAMHLRRQAKSLCEFPHKGALLDGLGARRRLVVAPYLIIYSVADPTEVVVLRILDGRRDLASLLHPSAPEEI